MTNYNLNANQGMQKTLQLPLNMQQSLLENTTTLESLSQQNLKSGGTGPKHTKSLEWCAGLFEGEGCLTLVNSGYWQCKIKMTDYDCLYDFYTAINCGTLYGLRKSPSQQEQHKPYAHWVLNKTQEIFNVVQALYPYLGERRQEKCREFLAWYFKKYG